jgi:hypothetical protein
VRLIHVTRDDFRPKGNLVSGFKQYVPKNPPVELNENTVEDLSNVPYYYVLATDETEVRFQAKQTNEGVTIDYTPPANQSGADAPDAFGAVGVAMGCIGAVCGAV